MPSTGAGESVLRALIGMLRHFLPPAERCWPEAVQAEASSIEGMGDRVRFLAGGTWALLRLVARGWIRPAFGWPAAASAGAAIVLLDTHSAAPCVLAPLVTGVAFAMGTALRTAPWRWAFALTAAVALPWLAGVPAPFVDAGELPSILTIALAATYAGSFFRLTVDRCASRRCAASL